MKKKMCPSWPIMRSEQDGNYCIKCPPNTNSKCELIPPKKKDVVVKAWASFDEWGRFQTAIYCKSKYCNVPATLHIKAKEYQKINKKML